MKAVVLAGGAGTRMAPYTRILPKPLLPIGDRPILDIIVTQLREAGVREVVMATGYLSSLIETFFGDGSGFGLDISYVREETALGTAGPLASVEDLDETFILMNGDVLTSLSYAKLLDAHSSSDAIATIATHTEEIELDYGVVTLGESAGELRQIEGIAEKPRHSCQVSMGIYVFEPRVLEYIQPTVRMEFPDLITRLLAAGERVLSYQHDGYWVDVGQVHHLDGAVREFERAAERFVGSSPPNGRPSAARQATTPHS